jgi:hypothetical protein
MAETNEINVGGSYMKRISRAEPGLIVLVLDDSGSMADTLPGTTDAKFVLVERYAGVILRELLERSTEMRGDQPVVKPRYFVEVIVYGGTPQRWSQGAVGDDIGALVQKYKEGGNSFGLGGKLDGTDTDAAFRLGLEFLERCLDKYKNCFPPMVFHLTDGESSTDAEPVAQKMMQLATNDGKVLVVNAFIGEATNLSYVHPTDFPGYVSEQEAGPSDYSIRLFRMSSQVPPAVRSNLAGDGVFPNIREGARLYFDVRTKDMLKHTIQVVGSQGSRR